MRIALLGLGRIGTVHLSHLTGFDEVEVVLHDPGLDGSTRAGLGVATADTLDEALDDADGVVVATPTALHAPHVLAAVERRVPVFCEKPIAVELEPSRAVVARAAEAGVEVQVGFHRRLVRTWECETLLPKMGPLPQTSQTAATVSLLIFLLERLGRVLGLALGPLPAGTGENAGAGNPDRIADTVQCLQPSVTWGGAHRVPSPPGPGTPPPGGYPRCRPHRVRHPPGGPG